MTSAIKEQAHTVGRQTLMTRQEVINYLTEANIIADAYEIGMDSAGTLYAGGALIAFVSASFYDKGEVRQGVQAALDLKSRATGAAK